MANLRGLSSGDMLRIEADSLGPVCGRFNKLSSDKLLLDPYPFQRAQRLSRKLNYKPVNQLLQFRPLSDTTTIDFSQIISISRRGTKAGTGAIIGGVIGTGTFMILGAVVMEMYDQKDNNEVIIKAGLIGGVIGAGTGALLGSIFPKWKEIYRRW